MNILLAEDDVVFRKTLEHLLTDQGHDVVSAPNGNLAWDMYQVDPRRIVISDWMMPEMSGLELCKKVRGFKDPAEYCYFLLLTANSGRNEYEEAMDHGVDDFLAKPIDASELFMRLRVADRILTSTARIRRLESLLPICSYCKRIRDKGNDWTQLEVYLNRHAKADFSHGICPDCLSHLDRDGFLTIPARSNEEA